MAELYFFNDGNPAFPKSALKEKVNVIEHHKTHFPNHNQPQIFGWAAHHVFGKDVDVFWFEDNTNRGYVIFDEHQMIKNFYRVWGITK